MREAHPRVTALETRLRECTRGIHSLTSPHTDRHSEIFTSPRTNVTVARIADILTASSHTASALRRTCAIEAHIHASTVPRAPFPANPKAFGKMLYQHRVVAAVLVCGQHGNQGTDGSSRRRARQHRDHVKALLRRRECSSGNKRAFLNGARARSTTSHARAPTRMRDFDARTVSKFAVTAQRRTSIHRSE